MRTNSDNRPLGFSGPAQNLAQLHAPAERVLVLPRQRAELAVPPAPCWQRIELRDVPESMGCIEPLLKDLAQRLTPDGQLVFDFENAQSMRRLRLVLEGRPGSFEPFGSPTDPNQALPLARVLDACSAAGLRVADVWRVPHPAEEVSPRFPRALLAEQMMPAEWLMGPPPVRFWLRCDRQSIVAGTVLIGRGNRAAVDVTHRALRAFLPADWQVIACAGTNEAASWNAGIVDATGETLWFLRAGSEPGPELFTELLAASIAAPAFPVNGIDGDLSGLMLSRNDVLRIGRFDEALNAAVAYEEYGMRLSGRMPRIELVEGTFVTPPAPIDSPATFATESKDLMAQWDALQAREPRSAAAVATNIEAAAPAVPWAGRQPKITLCMMARDEERFLGDCLRHAKDAVDEIVVVDTGSVDRTVEIAQSFGAKVVHMPWPDDFSAPRNRGLQECTGDWVLVLDADEFLAEGGAERIRELVQDPTAAGFNMVFTNVFSGGKTVGVVMVRLFRNLPGLQWQNVIHEQITPLLVRIGREHGLTLQSCEVEVMHHGYTDAVMDARNKNERNERLFRKQLALTPDDIYCLYKFGDFLRRVPHRNKESRELLERCFDLILAGPPSLPRELPYAGEVAALCALEYARTDQLDRAREIVDLALRHFIPTPNLHYIAASLEQAAGNHDAAIAHFTRCLRYRGQVLAVPIQEGITGHVSLGGIAQAWLHKGDHVRAARLLERAIACQPGWEVGHLTLSRLHLMQDRPHAALEVLSRFLAAHPDSAGACQQTSLILQRLGFKDQAIRMGRRAVELLEAGAMDHEAAHMKQILAAM